MSNSRSFRRSLKAKPHIRPSGLEQQPRPKGQPWNKGMALTTRPSLSTTRRWLEECVEAGTVERAGVERTGKPGRPAILWRLTEEGWEKVRAGRTPPAVREAQTRRLRRWENAKIMRAKDKAARAARELRQLDKTVAVRERELTEAKARSAEARHQLMLAEMACHATEALQESGGDTSVLLPEEARVLTENGLAAWDGDKLTLADDWLEAFREILPRSQMVAPA